MKLTRLTDPDKIDFTRELNGDVWKGHLSVPDYQFRDRLLAKSPMCQDMRIYVVTESEDINSTDDIMSSVEIIIRDGYKYNSKDGKVEKTLVKNGCIGGVFTNPKFRGKGIAKFMIDELNKICDEEDLEFVILYSEVGDYYSRCGYESFHVPIRTRYIDDYEAKIFNGSEKYSVDGFDVELIDYQGFKEVMDLHNEEEDKRIMAMNDGKSRVVFAPSEEVVNWFHLRIKYFCYNLVSSPEALKTKAFDDIIEEFTSYEPKKLGIKVSKNGELLGYVIWTFELKMEEEPIFSCKILHMFSKGSSKTRSGSDFTIKKLLSDLTIDYMKYSKKHFKVASVSVWTSDVDEAFGGEVQENSSLSAIRFKNEKSIWENNNKLPWF
ncbi:hypothetical protein CLIB1444_03S09318 [[Candida] jaroonii]|uniref:Uncharacterized protein n=1 Tax=[Candida] jaroonii TaxID=467808 RepID=A0ACA9Y6Q8_9ASCO|nr:hypothetical protein CLIB1444_03S09318 [[Candida] jaroonii]